MVGYHGIPPLMVALMGDNMVFLHILDGLIHVAGLLVRVREGKVVLQWEVRVMVGKGGMCDKGRKGV